MSNQHALPAWFFISLSMSLTGCGAGQEQTVSGPESAKLLPATKGYIVMTQPRGGLTAIRLPDLQETTIDRWPRPGKSVSRRFAP